MTAKDVLVRWSRDQYDRVIRARATSDSEQARSCAVHEHHATFSAQNACSAYSNAVASCISYWLTDRLPWVVPSVVPTLQCNIKEQASAASRNAN